MSDLCLWYENKDSVVKAVDGINFEIAPGTTLGLVGESGCGKSSVGRALVRLENPGSGSILWNGTELAGLSQKEFKKYRTELQIIFQDPYASLNPRMTIGAILEEACRVNKQCADVKKKIKKLLASVDLEESSLNRYPHEFSGGQRQRIGIARALAVDPAFIVCDEVVSALDVSVQAQVLNVLKELQLKKNLSYLFISHDLSVVRYIAHTVAVMYFGKLVEIGPVEKIFSNPQHPYTKLLLKSIPGETSYKNLDVDSRVLEGPGVWEQYENSIPEMMEYEFDHFVRETE